MIDYTLLEKALAEYQNASLPKHRHASAYKRILLHGPRLRQMAKESEEALTKQIAWLDDEKNQDRPTYETRFTEWENRLREYERACDLLDAAKSALPGLTLEVAA